MATRVVAMSHSVAHTSRLHPIMQCRAELAVQRSACRMRRVVCGQDDHTAADCLGGKAPPHYLPYNALPYKLANEVGKCARPKTTSLDAAGAMGYSVR